ncbi:MAG TPA: phenylalanine 4-monooxygenase [Pseudomonadales bacterium]|nr:phenylalanine 4-monooxygenase [Pseudomonadales bacterium]
MDGTLLTPDGKPADDGVIDQGWDAYTAADHAIWRRLFERQSALLPGRACREYLDGLGATGAAADGIPRFEAASEILEKATGWRIVAVAGLVPDDVFFWHLANRRFPVTNWIRTPEQMDYLQEPDVFHDFFGHVPMLMNPVFADYMCAYGRGGLKALGLGALPYLARLYWYTVEFGLIRGADGLRIYGSGIVSSRTESVYCLESPKPRRIAFDLLRVMQTTYRIDDLQAVYFVIDDFAQLFDATRPDFTPYYAALRQRTDHGPETLLDGDVVIPPDAPATGKKRSRR